MIGEFDAIIMAGGKGTRLLPYTAALPKPLVPLGKVPVLELILRQLRGYGFRHVCLAVNHLHRLIQAYFGDGESMGLRIDYAVENEPLGTCGPVSRILDRMAGDFLLMNGDLVTDLDLAAQGAASGARFSGDRLGVAADLATRDRRAGSGCAGAAHANAREAGDGASDEHGHLSAQARSGAPIP